MAKVVGAMASEDNREAILQEVQQIRLVERSTARRFLSDRSNQDRARDLAFNAFAFVEGLSESSTANPSIACRAGCSWCCYQRVDVTAPEVFAIVDFLWRTFDPASVHELRERVRRVDKIVRGLTAKDRFRLRVPCPLLVEGRCSVYAVRPIACRGWTSLNALDCASALCLGDPDYPVKIDLKHSLACHAVSGGIVDALEGTGVEGQSLELVFALLVALEKPKAHERWLMGEQMFTQVGSSDK